MSGLFDQLYRDESYQFTEEAPWTLFEIPGLDLVVAGLNSTLKESHLDEEETGFGHYGWVGEHQLKWFAERLEGYRERGWLCIGAVHHNVRRKALADDENLRDADDLERILVDSGLLSLVLHGHTHEVRMVWWSRTVPIFATGSTALNTDARPDEVPNQYQILAGQDLRGRDFAGQDLSGVDLARTSLAGALLRGADLSGASLRGADLTRVDLASADLTRTDFTGARLLGADLTAAHFDGTDFSRARMLGAKGLDPWPARASGFGATPARLGPAGPLPTPSFSTRMEPRSLAIGPDGSLLAIASGHGIRIWGPTDEVELLRLRGHEDQVTGVAFSPDGRTLASASDDQTVRLWGSASGQEIARLRGHEGPVFLASPSAPTGAPWPAPPETTRCACGAAPRAAASPSCCPPP